MKENGNLPSFTASKCLLCIKYLFETNCKKYEFFSNNSRAGNFPFSSRVNSPSYCCLLELNNLNFISFLSAPSGSFTEIGKVFTLLLLTSQTTSELSGQLGQEGSVSFPPRPGILFPTPS